MVGFARMAQNPKQNAEVEVEHERLLDAAHMLDMPFLLSAPFLFLKYLQCVIPLPPSVLKTYTPHVLWCVSYLCVASHLNGDRGCLKIEKLAAGDMRDLVGGIIHLAATFFQPRDAPWSQRFRARSASACSSSPLLEAPDSEGQTLKDGNVESMHASPLVAVFGEQPLQDVIPVERVLDEAAMLSAYRLAGTQMNTISIFQDSLSPAGEQMDSPEDTTTHGACC